MRQFYGIVLLDGTERKYPIYPFSETENDLPALEEFVELYYEELKDFYMITNGIDFGQYKWPFDTKSKEDFRNKWYQKGVVFY